MTIFKAIILSFSLAGISTAAEAAPQNNNRPSALALKGPQVAQATPSSKEGKRGQFKKQRHAEKLAQFDTNKNGQLDPAERTAMQQHRFKSLDLNKDGGITLAELKVAKEKRMAEHKAKRVANGKSTDSKWKERVERHMADKGQKLQERFARMDSNSNGSVS